MTNFYNTSCFAIRSFFLVVAFLWSFGFSCGQGNKQTLEETLIMFHTPADFVSAASRQYPLLVDLHGSGDVGKTDFEKFRKDGPAKLILDGEWPVDSFVVVIPVLNRDESIVDNNHLWPVDLIDDVIDSALARYPGKIDVNRIYMSGISLGAKGVWDYAKIHADRLAAIVPIAGNSKYDNLCNLVDLPVWALHGAEDNQVRHNRQSTTQPGRYGTSLLVDKINNNCETTPSIPVRLTLLEGMKHDGFLKYYDMRFGYNIFRWMLLHRRGSVENIQPLANAGPDLKVKAGTDLKLLGKYYDADGTLTTSWSKRSGPDVMMSGQQQSILTLFDLAAGVYVFRLTVTDNTGASAYDEVRVTVTDSDSDLAVTGMQVHAHFSNNIPRQLVKDLRQGENNFISTQDEGTRQFYLKVSTNNPLADVDLNLSMNYNASARDARSTWFIAGPQPGSFWRTDTTYIITVTPYAAGTPGISAQYEVTVVEHSLPVEFLDVSAHVTGHGIDVQWTTATETNNDFFTIERSDDTETFAPIGKVQGAGNSKTVRNYRYTDHLVHPGVTYYYRIKQTDMDGRYDYSKIAGVHITGGAPEFTVFPNPWQEGDLTIRLSGDAGQSGVAVHLVDALGRIQYATRIETATAAQGLRISSDSPLEKGIYILKVQQGHYVAQEKVVVY